MSDMYSAHEWLRRYYNYVLLYTDAGEEPKKYLLDRGIDEYTIKKFSLGYAPKKVGPTLQFLKGKKFSYRKLVNERVLYRYKNGNLTDPFRGRIIFPIDNHNNKIVAFGGRSLER